MKTTQLMKAFTTLALAVVVTTGCEKFRENRQYDSVLDSSVA